jgi:hypothetical protein
LAGHRSAGLIGERGFAAAMLVTTLHLADAAAMRADRSVRRRGIVATELDR